MKQACPRLKLAVCVHETHCRAEQSGWRRFLSAWQKRTVGNVVRQADVVFATIDLWREWVINEYEVPPDRVRVLPIGSNIPAVDLTAQRRHDARRRLRWAETEVVAVAFGSYETQWQALERFRGVLERGLEQGRLDRLVCIGGQGGQAPERVLHWGRCLRRPDVFQVLGSRSAIEIGEVLAASDVGLAATPPAVIDKSGAYRAFAAAGLPTLISTPPADGRLNNGLLVPADACDWQQLPWELSCRRRFQQQAEAEFGWDEIARKALSQLKAT